jgi:CubicO group peptidase (beta-lactamase class C family)
MLYKLPTSSMMVIVSGKVVYSYGDIAQVSYLASARKSILSMLYGKYVANGTINLNQTLDEFGIDEDGGLLPIEKTARLRDLITASSGVYHPAGSPGGDESNAPRRGSQQPGKYFLYNNWDFNVAGAIFEKATGKSIFEALDTDLAGPLQMQDFQRSRQRMMGYENQSRYLAYHMFLSGRDMARLGLLMARGGQWNRRTGMARCVPCQRKFRTIHPGAAGARHGDCSSACGDGRVCNCPEFGQDQCRAAARERV